MKFLSIVFGMTLILALVAFVAVAVMDVPVEQTEVSKTVSNERFYNKGGTQ
jgi:hypothetical protein